MTKFVIHCIAPVPWALILCRTSPLKAKPRPLWTLHVATANTWLVVQGGAGATSFLVCSQVELWNDTCNDVIIQVFRVLEREPFEALPKIKAPLAHDVIRDNLLRLWIVGGTPHNYVVCVGIPGAESEECKKTKLKLLLTFRPFGGGLLLLGV